MSISMCHPCVWQAPTGIRRVHQISPKLELQAVSDIWFQTRLPSLPHPMPCFVTVSLPCSGSASKGLPMFTTPFGLLVPSLGWLVFVLIPFGPCLPQLRAACLPLQYQCPTRAALSWKPVPLSLLMALGLKCLGRGKEYEAIWLDYKMWTSVPCRSYFYEWVLSFLFFSSE